MNQERPSAWHSKLNISFLGCASWITSCLMWVEWFSQMHLVGGPCTLCTLSSQLQYICCDVCAWNVNVNTSPRLVNQNERRLTLDSSTCLLSHSVLFWLLWMLAKSTVQLILFLLLLAVQCLLPSSALGVCQLPEDGRGSVHREWEERERERETEWSARASRKLFSFLMFCIKHFV